jgi:hypothetical protein
MAMNMVNKEQERHELEMLLPWHATGTLPRRDAERVSQALAGDGELARSYELVREELAETIHLNETLGAPSARAMEKLFAAIDAEEAHAPLRARSIDFAQRISEFLSQFAPRTLAWSAAVGALAILAQAAIIAGVVLREDSAPAAGPKLANAVSQGSFAIVRFVPQATADEITKFLGAYKVTLVEGPLKSSAGLYRLRLAESQLPPAEADKIIRQMQDKESRIVGFIAPASE